MNNRINRKQVNFPVELKLLTPNRIMLHFKLKSVLKQKATHSKAA